MKVNKISLFIIISFYERNYFKRNPTWAAE